MKAIFDIRGESGHGKSYGLRVTILMAVSILSR
jgi:hypothetical protein